MSRRRRHEEHENHERWLVSYADFITLLFAFFVVMYSISSVNEGKYKILSDTLTGVFNQPDRSIKPIPIGEERPLGDSPPRDSLDDSDSHSDNDIGDVTLRNIATGVREAFGDLIQSDQLTVRGNEMWIEIELSSGLLFPSGDALPNNQAFGIIEKIANILAPYRNPIKVEGFTDNLPIETSQFPTNWELSAARAASIVRMLAMDGVDPTRLAAVGYGEFQPITDNTTAEGRARNRRVVLVIARHLDSRRPGEQQPASGTQPAAAPGQEASQP